jgi:hypothetical protein
MKFKHLEQIPADVVNWRVDVANAGRLSATLKANWENVLLFKRLATPVVDGPVKHSVDDLRWTGPSKYFREFCARLEAPELQQKAETLAASRNRDLEMV